MLHSVVYIDDRRDHVDPADRGLAYGDGLFETMHASDGRIRWLDFHLDRLAEGCRRLAIVAPERAIAGAEILSRVPPSGDAIVKLLLTRGSGPRGYAPPANPVVTIMISVMERTQGPDSVEPVAAVTLQFRLAESETLAGIKHLCRIEQVLAQLELQSRRIQEGILLSRSGKVVGCTSSNLFLVSGSGLLTPKIDTAGISGVMRRVVIEACRRRGMPVREEDVVPGQLEVADGLFQTNAVIGIREIGELDGRPFAAPEMLERVRSAVREFADA